VNSSKVSTKLVLSICLLALLHSFSSPLDMRVDAQSVSGKDKTRSRANVRYEKVPGGKKFYISSEKPFASFVFVNDDGKIVSKPALAHVKFVMVLPKNIRLIVGVGPGLSENPELLKSFPAEDIYGLDMSTDNFNAVSPVEELLKIVVNYPNFRYLNFMGNPTNDRALPTIAEMKKLNSLTVSYTQITGERLATLGSITQLKEFSASRISNVGKVLSKLENSRTLQTLRVSSRQLNGQDFSAIGTMKNLLILDVSSSTIDQKALNQICNLPMLHMLNMRYCRFNLTDFEPILKLRKLDVFQVSYDMMRRYAILHSIKQRMPLCHWLVTN
jgi:hypothetical protein